MINIRCCAKVTLRLSVMFVLRKLCAAYVRLYDGAGAIWAIKMKTKARCGHGTKLLLTI